jgi:hypothetical protein
MMPARSEGYVYIRVASRTPGFLRCRSCTEAAPNRLLF